MLSSLYHTALVMQHPLTYAERIQTGFCHVIFVVCFVIVKQLWKLIDLLLPQHHEGGAYVEVMVLR